MPDRPARPGSASSTEVIAATVSRHDVATGSGAVLLDDGQELLYGPEAFAVSGLRFLRLGQRVVARRHRDQIIALTLATLTLPPATDPGD